MQYFFISFFIYFIIYSLFSLGSLFHYYFNKSHNISNIITGYAITGILINFLFFSLRLNVEYLCIILIIIFLTSFIFLIYKDKSNFLDGIKQITKLTIIPYIFFIFFGFFYGEQYYVFRGNYWDYFNYVSSGLLYSKYNYSQVLELISISNPLLFEVGLSAQLGRPLVMVFLSIFFNYDFINIFLLGYSFKIFLILLSTIACFTFFKNIFYKNKNKEIFILTTLYILSFWNIYIVEIDAISQLSSLPIFFILMSNLDKFFDQLKNKDYKFLLYFVIMSACFFLLYAELFVIFVTLVVIYGLYSKKLNINFIKTSYIPIIALTIIFIIFTLPNYEATYIFLLNQANAGFFGSNNWWGYFGGFILGRENPIIDSDFVYLFKSNLESLKNLKSILVSLNQQLINFDYTFYQFKIIPSLFGFYYLSDINIFFINKYFEIIFLIFLTIFLVIYLFRNIKIIFKLNENLTILIKSFITVFLILSLMLIINFQIWSIIKLFFYFSILTFILTILKLKLDGGHIKFKFNNLILILVVIFPIYKFSDFNHGILRYDSFPSVMSKTSKTKVNWHFKNELFEKCKYVELDLNQNKLNDFKRLYLTINLFYNDFVFISKNKLINPKNDINKRCHVNKDYFK